jgi:hypothetical protein
MTRDRLPLDQDDAPVWVPDSSTAAWDTLPEEFWRIRRRVVDRLGLSDLRDDPYKGSYLTYVAAGGEVHEHRDARLQVDGRSMALLRCNVLLARASRGGMPVIDGEEIDVADRGMWAFHPTELLHSATTVSGEVGRVTLSFGFVVDPDRVWQRPFRTAPAVTPDLVRDITVGLSRRPVTQAQSATVEFVLTRSGEFEVAGLAGSLAVDPWEVWGVVRRLQKARLVESLSPPVCPEGRLLIR